MAPTFRHGKGAVIKLVYSGTTYNLSSGVDEASLPRAVDTAEVTTYGDNDKVYIPGLRDGTLSISGHWASTYESRIVPMLGSTGVTFVFGPEGGSTGRVKRSGSAIITSYEASAPVSGKVNMSLQLQLSGAISTGTF